MPGGGGMGLPVMLRNPGRRGAAAAGAARCDLGFGCRLGGRAGATGAGRPGARPRRGRAGALGRADRGRGGGRRRRRDGAGAGRRTHDPVRARDLVVDARTGSPAGRRLGAGRRRGRWPRAGSASAGARAAEPRRPARARDRFGLRLAAQALRVGQPADAVGRRIVDARRVALHADLELFGELDHDVVLDAQLSSQLVDPDLLGGQATFRPLTMPMGRAPARGGPPGGGSTS